ncbi:arsenate reductase (glutaredoxin) [Pandoraea sp.]|uniref:arsenate reductase (glutaredoxin) n=1 Tax=Pandoraea sp. TaxID=1883445 RepID=UPI001218D948|nr:arsenate reductase (glutaredoxin) [Pandoraea sp.]MBU6491794.1 arsenate reductase (glutaredoxin) [Burkholderiales bacterium]MDE2287425.1 arsenate reductase (glutaredoxin) [Burkholderiales bacterium]MDE2610740.1 arsenate reductase (glutaredoxin) [Burkholderiales bacterium]TAL52664.1 MAG: arsenate reductase (glutaredoxin) [Pandoraea sp.]TAM16333.1 MAG: arsenate reductase (glutaredoxin) [Pandoraea sp.]
MITIYHNPRCSKSRGACDLLAQSAAASGETVQVIEYLKTPPTLAQLQVLQKQLGVSAREMLREGETEYQALGLDDPSLDDTTLLRAVAEHPKLLQRPIVVRGERAVIARPPEKVQEIF